MNTEKPCGCVTYSDHPCAIHDYPEYAKRFPKDYNAWIINRKLGEQS